MEIKINIRRATCPEPRMSWVVAALLILGAPVVWGQDQSGLSSLYQDPCTWLSNCGHGPGSGNQTNGPPGLTFDPCYIAQNALRPCAREQRTSSSTSAMPVGVDPNLVGTWELPQKGGIWVLEIHRDGTYKFRSEADDGVAPNAGTFSASNGRWSLKAKSGYADSGYYLFQPPDIWIAKGQLGIAAWQQRGRQCVDKK
ncbi:MAG TPA: hypothetical protein VEN79_07860 [Terriglobia bacterium]|nr:hypothetical protein [Terriglobia bacterium]